MSDADDYVKGVMSSPVVTVTTQATVAQALRAMIDHDIGAIVVVDGDAPVGVFTERDVTRKILDEPDLLGRSIGDEMSSPVTSVSPNDEVVFIFKTMSDQKIRRLPVVDSGKLVGIVTERDLLRWVDAVANST
ncbi:MAG TPA: CBS domain-containing protein [Actinomycetota bacterium]|jgi:CBS domain-containing protein|nr:CBS domain-containing protein [Actinomycetota bacterium]